MSITPLDVNQVCSGGPEVGLQVVLGMPTGFYQCVQMVPQDWDAVMPLLNM